MKQLNPITDVSVVFTVINNVLVTPFTYLPVIPGIVDSCAGSNTIGVLLFRIMPQEAIALFPSKWHVTFLCMLMGIYSGPVGVKSTKNNSNTNKKYIKCELQLLLILLSLYRKVIVHLVVLHQTLTTTLIEMAIAQFIAECALNIFKQQRLSYNEICLVCKIIPKVKLWQIALYDGNKVFFSYSILNWYLNLVFRQSLATADCSLWTKRPTLT